MQGLSHRDSDGLTASQCCSPWDQQGERWDQRQLSLAGTGSLFPAPCCSQGNAEKTNLIGPLTLNPSCREQQYPMGG